MDVVGTVASKELFRRRVKARKRVRPIVVALSHQCFVESIIKLLECAAQHLHTIASLEAGESSEGEVARGSQVMNRCATRFEIKSFGIEMYMPHILCWIITACREPGRVLPRVTEIPDILLAMVVAHIGEQDRSM